MGQLGFRWSALDASYSQYSTGNDRGKPRLQRLRPMVMTLRRLTRSGGTRQLQDVTETTAVAERVLVVDDEPDIVALVAYHLAKSGYTVSTATSGPEGLAVARRDKPSLIVLDLILPGLSGLEVMEELRGDNAT